MDVGSLKVNKRRKIRVGVHRFLSLSVFTSPYYFSEEFAMNPAARPSTDA